MLSQKVVSRLVCLVRCDCENDKLNWSSRKLRWLDETVFLNEFAPDSYFQYLCSVISALFISFLVCCRVLVVIMHHVVSSRRKVSRVSWSSCNVSWQWQMSRVLQTATANQLLRLYCC